MTEIDNDLASCKICGPSIAVRLTWVCDASGMIQHYGYCWMCAAEGPKRTDEIMAVSEWNRHQEQEVAP